MEDPRDGLTLFGPLDAANPLGIRPGLIGTARGIDYYNWWRRRLDSPIHDLGSQAARPLFPGIEASFRTRWTPDPTVVLQVDEVEVNRAACIEDRHQRVFATASLFADRIVEALRSEEASVDLWFVIIPDLVWQNCRPKSQIPIGQRTDSPVRMGASRGKRLWREPSLFEAENVAATAYSYDVDFHNQLKARLLRHLAPTQVVRESTIAPPPSLAGPGRPARDVSRYAASIAWNLGTAAFYKAGGRPWKIAAIRDGVCYIGVVFKRDDRHADPRTACCAAQMFLDSGDGLVFRGAVGPWYSPDDEQYHLSREAAKNLIRTAVTSYETYAKAPPKELFIHGRAYFSDEEWEGFSAGVDANNTQLVGIRIRRDGGFRLYRPSTHCVLRGLAYSTGPRSASLWTTGYTPRLRTYAGREVPRPLRIDLLRGHADMDDILRDVLVLTKLNYNACMFADGLPVTLRFADRVGEILTAGPTDGVSPLPFKYYI